ncbi:MAG: Hsp33 family molecular chaperone HslO [Bdellovibrionales bacterium]
MTEQNDEDQVLPFQIEASPMRGRLVRLGPCLDTILRRHDYPYAVNRLLGEAAALTAALGTALKFDGVFTIQTKTDGAVSRLVVDVTSQGAVRACAQFDPSLIKAKTGKDSLLGKGQLVLTVDQTASDERYQGIVQLDGDDLASAFKLYFRQSEQIPTGLLAASHQDETGAWHAGCLLLQRMPSQGGVGGEALEQDTAAAQDSWHHAMLVMQTCTESELTDPSLPPDRLLYRLFHELGVRAYDPVQLYHACRCSKEKIVGVLSGMPKEELADMVEENGKITVTCQFCSQIYSFDPSEF